MLVESSKCLLSLSPIGNGVVTWAHSTTQHKFRARRAARFCHPQVGEQGGQIRLPQGEGKWIYGSRMWLRSRLREVRSGSLTKSGQSLVARLWGGKTWLHKAECSQIWLIRHVAQGQGAIIRSLYFYFFFIKNLVNLFSFLSEVFQTIQKSSLFWIIRPYSPTSMQYEKNSLPFLTKISSIQFLLFFFIWVIVHPNHVIKPK